jgi:hypothetical protein
VAPNPPDFVRDAWTAAALRRFRWMLGLVVGLFLVTETAAHLDVVAALRPLSFHTVATNILFAIGFGSPIVLYLSGLPPPREALGAVVAGAVIFLALAEAVGMRGVPQAIIGLGLGCLLMLAWRTRRTRDDQRTTALLYLLPSILSLAYTLLAGVFLDTLPRALPYTFDSLAYVADSGFGFQPSFAMGTLFAAVPPLSGICFAIYAAPPPILAFVYTLQLRAKRPPPIDAITVLLALGLMTRSRIFHSAAGRASAWGVISRSWKRR